VSGDGNIYCADVTGTPPAYVMASSYWNNAHPCNTGAANPFCSAGTSNATVPLGTTLIGGPSEQGEAKNFWTDQDWGTPNGWQNRQGVEGTAVGFAPGATITTNQELEYCATDYTHCINHPVTILIDCNGSTYTDATYPAGTTRVFPAYANAELCSLLPGASSGYPPAGALVFIDITPTQIAALSLANVYKGILTALHTYGGYFLPSNKTLGNAIQGGEGLQSPMAYQIQSGGSVVSYTTGGGVTGYRASGGTVDPVINYLNVTEGIACGGTSGTSPCKYNFIFWPTVAASYGAIGPHWHMANPCVPAGLSGGAIGWTSSSLNPHFLFEVGLSRRMIGPTPVSMRF
jgi:hypothetical protein